MNPRYLWACLFWLASCSLWAQERGPLFFTADNDQPLPPAAIQQLVEDEMGMIWVGGEMGLFRYDGLTWQHFPARDTSASLAITALHLDHTGQLWVGHENGHISRLGQDSLDRYPIAPDILSRPIKGLFWDHQDRLWIGCYGEGLYVYHAGQLANINDSDGLADNDIYTLLGMPDGAVWVGTDGGLSRCRMRGDTIEARNYGQSVGLPDNIVRHLSLDATGALWVGTYDQGICRFDTARLRVSLAQEDWPYGPITSLARFRDEIWVGTATNGLMAFDTTHLVRQWQLPEQGVSSLMPDRSGNMWAATPEEGLQYAYAGLRSFATEIPLSSEGVLAVATDAAGHVWYSTAAGVFVIMQQNGKRMHQKIPLPATQTQVGITQLCADISGWMWLGSFEGGIFRYHLGQGKIQQLKAGRELDNGSILAMTGRGNEMWLSTLSGLSRIKVRADGSLAPTETFDRETALGINYVLNLVADSAGKVWVLTDGQGIFTYMDEQFVRVGGDSLYARSRIKCIALDDQGHLWASTKSGRLFRAEDDSFMTVGQSTPTEVKEVFAISSLPYGRLLLLHDQGLTVYDIAHQVRMSLRAELGLEGKRLDLYQQTIARTPQDDYWIATQLGLHHFLSPEKDQKTGPQLYFHPVSIFLSDQVDTTQHLFGPDEDHLTFAFTGLWYRDPNAVSYAYFLEGYDLNWAQTQDRSVTYPRLGAGAYTFRLRTRLYDQFMPEEGIAYRFKVLPPIWRRPWFLFLALALMVFVGYMLLRRREAQLAERSRLEQEKMRFQFETLRNQVNPHFLFNSFNTLAAIIEDDSPGAVDYVNHLSDLFRNMLNFRERQLIPLMEELDVLQTYFFLQKHRYGENLTLHLDIPKSLHARGLPPLTLQMLIENAIKHNVISKSNPLKVSIVAQPPGYITVSNPLQPKRTQAPGTRVGLQNIQARYALLTDVPVQIDRTARVFSVQIPLLEAPSLTEG